jgi:hypothetical protein
MPISIDYLPYPTPLDPSEDPADSIDPLGLTTPAEYLANLLVPGFTVRTWRARMITFDAVAAHVASGVVKRMNDREDVRVPARLIFERLYVSSVARAEKKNPEEILAARRTLPGIGLARAALSRNEPLSKNNFLKGQAVNGLVGVTTRLAKNMDVLTSDMRAGRASLDLLQEWAYDEQLLGVLEFDSPTQSDGSVWVNDVIQAIIDNLSKKPWPRDGSAIWDKILTHLRLDKIGKREKDFLQRLLERDASRKCLFEVLRKPNVLSISQKSNGERGQQERAVLTEGVMKNLGNEVIDEQVRIVIEAIECYEHASALMTQGFESLLWGLKNKGRLEPADLLLVSQVDKRLKETIKQIPLAKKELDTSIRKLGKLSGTTLVIDSLEKLSGDMNTCVGSTDGFLNSLMGRHEKVQKDKRKGVWIDRAQTLTLLPGFGVDGDGPPIRVGTYLHPFRITNSYSFLADLGLVKWKASNED